MPVFQIVEKPGLTAAVLPRSRKRIVGLGTLGEAIADVQSGTHTAGSRNRKR